jgi:hypothetical protein
MPGSQAHDASIEKYSDLFFQGDEFGVSVAKVAELGYEHFKGMCMHTQFASNAFWMTGKKLHNPAFT